MHDTTGREVETSEPAVEHKTETKGRKNPHLENIQMFMPTEPVPDTTFFGRWGHVSIFTYLLGKAAVKRLYPLVPHTLVPILKLCSDNKEDVEAAFKELQKLHEKISFFNSPYDKYRKIYGNYVREIEWCCVQLRKYFTKRAFEDLVIDSTYSYINEILGKYIVKMKKSMLAGKTRESITKEPGKYDDLINRIVTKMVDFYFKYVFNLTGWMAGDVEIPSYNVRTGEMIMKVVDCTMLKSPRMKQLPEDACILA